MYRKSVLNNGLTVVTEAAPHFHSVAVGVWLTVGSRDEGDRETGLSHFLEHMAFKGTPRRSALEVARQIDQIGGSINAFTTKEHTCFHGRVLAEHLPRLMDLLGDLILNPLFQANELERERQIILEEIHAQDDAPDDLVQVHFARHFWGDTPFGRPILGDAAQIAALGRADLLAYRQATYRPERTVVAAAGRVQHEELAALVDAAFSGFANGAPLRQRAPVATHPGLYPLERDLEQVYLCLGTQGVAAGDPRRFPVSMLHLLLGGNMSSRLFQVIREQLGLAYSIYAFTSFFSDAGLLGIGAGVSPRNLEAIMAAIGQELNKFQNEPVSAAELAAAREYVRGSVFLAAEDCDHLMMRLAKNELNFGHYIPLDDIVQGLLKVSAQEIQTLAQEMFQPEKWGAAFLGPVDGDKKGGNFLAF